MIYNLHILFIQHNAQLLLYFIFENISINVYVLFKKKTRTFNLSLSLYI